MSDIVTIDTRYAGVSRGTAAYLIHDGGRAAFVETGTTRSTPRLLAALDEQGLAPAQVDLVIITHVHLDHAGGASALMRACPNAKLLAHPKAARHAIDPSKLVKSAVQVYGEKTFAELYGTIDPIDAGRVRVMEDGEVQRFGAGDLTFAHTRGHANHHFVVHDSSHNAVFTGDALGLVYPDLQSAGLFAIPSTSPTDFDAAEALASLERILATGAERAYLTHFGGQDELTAIAAQLAEQLAESGQIVDQAYAEVPDEELDRYCAARVDALFERLLRRRGLPPSASAHEMLAMDRRLNAQGLAFAVRKRRFKAQRSR